MNEFLLLVIQSLLLLGYFAFLSKAIIQEAFDSGVQQEDSQGSIKGYTGAPARSAGAPSQKHNLTRKGEQR